MVMRDTEFAICLSVCSGHISSKTVDFDLLKFCTGTEVSAGHCVASYDTPLIKQCYVTLSARRISIHFCTYSITNFPSTLTDCGLSWTTALSKSNNLICYCGGF